MPNKKSRHKRGIASTERMHVRTSRKGDSVKALLEGLPGLTLRRISTQADRQLKWRAWLESHLPPAAFSHVSGVVERCGTLVVMTDSAAWSARIRYYVADLEELLKKEYPQVREVVVKVLPGRGK
jgi:hypothetical protein